MSLRLRGVRYAYAGTTTPVLHEIDLDVERGQIFGVVGPNDAGKSTLCLVAAGLAPGVIAGRLDGTVELDGTDVRELRPWDVAQRVGILFQNPQTQLSGTAATVFEEVAFGPRNLGLPLGQLIERVEWALDTVGIADLAARDPQRVSGGQAQLVALASVLALRPAVLVLDEPTSQLDPAGTRLVSDRLRRIAAETGTAILIVEHKAAVLARVASNVLALDAGRIAAQGGIEVLGRADVMALGVQPPASTVIARAAAEAGVSDRLAGLDLAAMELAAAGTEARGTGSDDRADGAARSPSDPASAAAETLAIRCADVGFTYPDGTRALREVDLAVARGERVAIVGQNGSGKSTLVRQFIGLLRPGEGEIEVNGRAVGRRHVADLAREIGLAFQNPDRQLFSGRARAEVEFGARNVGLRGEALERAVAAALDAVGLAARAEANPYDLGYSRRKLLSLASILAMSTPILVLDEPTTGQDQRGIERVAGIVSNSNAAGRTVIAISHDIGFVAASFERMAVMRGGNVILDEPVESVFAERNWTLLASTDLEPPLAAKVGITLGVG
ncbi:MAG TPA: ABC transporter ATP-binding protein, partial [Candidatus Limnocylindrales bacterium]|nr:ABC transporter ATP-binding protein [Candidatus Limnocylindrales bacterium]